MSVLRIEVVGYDHHDAQLLIEQVQAEYVQLYGGPDASPIDPAEFSSPQGLFAVGYQDDQPVAMGGWRLHPRDNHQTSWAAPAAEVKRMFVLPAARGQGFARDMLLFLERRAQQDGVSWLLLETGPLQPAAVALYRSAGYVEIPPFGHYAHNGVSLHLGRQLAAEPARR